MLSGKCLGEEKWLSPPKVWESREGAMRARPPSKDEKSQRWVPGSLAKAWQSRRGGGVLQPQSAVKEVAHLTGPERPFRPFSPGSSPGGGGRPREGAAHGRGGASLANGAELPSPASGHVGCFPNLAAAWDA